MYIWRASLRVFFFCFNLIHLNPISQERPKCLQNVLQRGTTQWDCPDNHNCIDGPARININWSKRRCGRAASKKVRNISHTSTCSRDIFVYPEMRILPLFTNPHFHSWHFSGHKTRHISWIFLFFHMFWMICGWINARFGVLI